MITIRIYKSSRGVEKFSDEQIERREGGWEGANQQNDRSPAAGKDGDAGDDCSGPAECSGRFVLQCNDQRAEVAALPSVMMALVSVVAASAVTVTTSGHNSRLGRLAD